MAELDLVEAVAHGAPPSPKTVRDTGLDLAFLVDLSAKAMLDAGKLQLPTLSAQLRLSMNVLREVMDAMLAAQLAEVTWRGETDLDVQHQLTAAGRQRAAEALARSRYLGPAPVTLEAWREAVKRQSARHPNALRLGYAELQAAFADDCIATHLRDQLGAAMQSNRSLLLHGPSGAGKSTLARKLGKLMPGSLSVPYAILIGGQVLLLHDSMVHQPPSPLQVRQLGERHTDARWASCRRPLVQLDAALRPEQLELRFDEVRGVYHAPPQVQACGGMLLVDDVGRHAWPATALLDRWAEPLEAGYEQLTLQGGQRVALPVDSMLVLCTCSAPREVLDDAALRRIAYKVHVGALDEAHYRHLFRQLCRSLQVVYDEAVMQHLLCSLHGAAGEPLLAATPRELLMRVCDFASLAGHAPRLSIPAIEQAWISMLALRPRAQAGVDTVSTFSLA